MDYLYPVWGEVIGWFLGLSSMLIIPGYAIYKLAVTPGTLREVRINSHHKFITFSLLYSHETCAGPGKKGKSKSHSTKLLVECNFICDSSQHYIIILYPYTN